MDQNGNFWPLTGVHSQVSVEVDTAERWLVQGESQRSGKFLFFPIRLLTAAALSLVHDPLTPSPHKSQ